MIREAYFFIIKIIFRLFLNFQVYGKENLLKVNRFTVFVSNHKSHLVPYLLYSGLPWFSLFNPIHYLYKKNIFDSLPLKSFSKLPISSINTRLIIPISIFGVENLSWKKIFLRQKEIIVYYGKPLTIKDHLSEIETSIEIQNTIKATRVAMLEVIDKSEKNFWANYGKLYHPIEK